MADQRKKPVAKKAAAKKVIDKKPHELTELDYHAIQLHELFEAYKRAGFDHGTAITLIIESDSHPSWFKKTTVDDFALFDDFEDEDDLD